MRSSKKRIRSLEATFEAYLKEPSQMIAIYDSEGHLLTCFWYNPATECPVEKIDWDSRPENCPKCNRVMYKEK